MADERYRIRADQLDDYAGHPEGVELTTEHDVTPPSPTGPIRSTPMSPATEIQSYGQISSVAHGPRGRRRNAAIGFAVVCLAGFVLNVLWNVVTLVRG